MSRRVDRQQQRGLSLNELLLLLAVVAVLTAACIPLYRGYAYQTHRSLAQNVLRDIVEQQERWAARNHRYTNLQNLGYPAPAIYIGTDGVPQGSANRSSIYRISLATRAAAPARCETPAGTGGDSEYLLIATPIQAQKFDERCAALCLNQSGERGASGPDGADICWAR